MGQSPSRRRASAASGLEELARAHEELRELARGRHPAALTRGLTAAIGALATRSPVPVEYDVADDGRGGATAGEGSGLLGLNDRVEALRGRLSVTSPPGVGTTLRAEFPLSA